MSPPDDSSRPRWRRWLTPGNVLLAALLIWSAPRLLPHLGAVVGIGTGERRAPEFRVHTLDGTVLTADSLRGQVVLVNFWATWCAPCRVEMPLLQAMHDRHRARGFLVLGLSVDRAAEATVRSFLREREVSYPVAIVGAEEERAFGGVRGYPTSILLDRRGMIRHSVVGPLAPATLEPAVRRLLDEGVD